MTIDQTQVLTARWVLPIVSEPIHRGWIRLRGEEVMEVGRGQPASGAIDLGDVALLPGLVNAHTHLEFSDCIKPIGEPGILLHDWILKVISARDTTTTVSKQRAITAGLQESKEAGVRLLGEITTPPCDYPSTLGEPELITFAEVLGLNEQRAEDRLAAAVSHHRDHENGGWSPHSPYSTTPQLIRRCIDLAVQSDRMVSMHVAESPAERELIDGGTGYLVESLKEIGVWREGLFPLSSKGYVDLIELLSLAPQALLVHGNDLRTDEIDCIANHPNLVVVYCPRTHAFFGYEPHPVGQLVERGIRVALGTDSRASNPDLNVWKEVQYLLTHRNDLRPSQVLAMATIHGADALRRGDIGRIDVACRPGLGVVSTDAACVDDLWASFANNEYVALRDIGSR